MHKYFITIDPFTDISGYDEAINALNNNQIEYNEFLSIKPPYNWYINIDKLPIMVNYEIGTNQDIRFLISKVTPLRPNEEYLLKRRDTDGSGEASVQKFIYNDVLNPKNIKNKYALIFRFKSKEELQTISRDLNARIYILGTYKGRKLAFTNNIYVAGEITPSFIIVEKQKKELNKLGELELELSYKGLKSKDKLLKNTSTPYVEDGKYFPTKVNLN